jgi:hypothetical protein
MGSGAEATIICFPDGGGADRLPVPDLVLWNPNSISQNPPPIVSGVEVSGVEHSPVNDAGDSYKEEPSSEEEPSSKEDPKKTIAASATPPQRASSRKRSYSGVPQEVADLPGLTYQDSPFCR